ncbi:MAG TPA: hypothetical protein VFB63_01770 [Bryobacteraceae bacterium]|nr:hypothetical protein [Bryobacteraceae bacterium]
MKNLVLCLLLVAVQFTALAQSATLSNAVAQLKSESQSAADEQTKSLASELGTKTSALSKSLEGNPAAQKQLESAVSAVLGQNGPAAINALQSLTTAKLTPEQTRLSKDVYNVGSAYVVKKNFASLEGSQNEVNQVVAALRKGSATEALPPLKTLGQQATLTQPQKDLVASLTDKYAPGLKKASEGLKSLPGLKK